MATNIPSRQGDTQPLTPIEQSSNATQDVQARGKGVQSSVKTIPPEDGLRVLDDDESPTHAAPTREKAPDPAETSAGVVLKLKDDTPPEKAPVQSKTPSLISTPAARRSRQKDEGLYDFKPQLDYTKPQDIVLHIGNKLHEEYPPYDGYFIGVAHEPNKIGDGHDYVIRSSLDGKKPKLFSRENLQILGLTAEQTSKLGKTAETTQTWQFPLDAARDIPDVPQGKGFFALGKDKFAEWISDEAKIATHIKSELNKLKPGAGDRVSVIRSDGEITIRNIHKDISPVMLFSGMAATQVKPTQQQYQVIRVPEEIMHKALERKARQIDDDERPAESAAATNEPPPPSSREQLENRLNMRYDGNVGLNSGGENYTLTVPASFKAEDLKDIFAPEKVAKLPGAVNKYKLQKLAKPQWLVPESAMKDNKTGKPIEELLANEGGGIKTAGIAGFESAKIKTNSAGDFVINNVAPDVLPNTLVDDKKADKVIIRTHAIVIPKRELHDLTGIKMTLQAAI